MEKIAQFKKTFLYLFKHKKTMVKAFAISIIFLLINYLKIWAIFAGLGIDITLLEIVVVITVARMIAYYIIMPGGTGAGEYSNNVTIKAVGEGETP